MTIDVRVPASSRGAEAETGVAALGTAAGFTALFSAAACCVLPLMLVGTGIGAAALAPLVRWHWPLTAFAAVAVVGGWLLHLRKRRAVAARRTFVLLSLASLFVALSAIWPSYLEKPLVRLLGGA